MASEMVPVPQNDPASFVPAQLERPLTTEDLMGGADALTWCSMVLNTQEDRMLAFNARHGVAVDLDDVTGKELHLRGAIAHYATKGSDEHGEINRFVRIVLIGADGTLYESGSRGIRDSIRDLAFAIGQGPWEPAVIVKMFKIKGSHPSPMQKLQYIGRAAPAEKPKGKPHG